MKFEPLRRRLWPLLMVVGIYIIIPTPEEIVIHSTIAIFLSKTLKVTVSWGVILSAVIYRSLGLISLAVGLILGGEAALRRLKKRMKNLTGR